MNKLLMSEIIAQLYECNRNFSAVYQNCFLYCNEKVADFKDEEKKRSVFHQSIQDPFRSSFHPARNYPLRFVETGQKRDFYNLIQIGKQFVSSFEIHRAEKCAYVNQYGNFW